MEIDGRHVGMKYLERTNMCVFVPSIIKLHLKQKENRTKKRIKQKREFMRNNGEEKLSQFIFIEAELL